MSSNKLTMSLLLLLSILALTAFVGDLSFVSSQSISLGEIIPDANEPGGA
jgi:hypothetical protein